MSAAPETRDDGLSSLLGALMEHWWDDAEREPRLAEIAAAVATWSDDERSAFMAGVLPPARRLRIALEAPDVLRGLAVPLVAAPYWMTTAARGHATTGLTVDAHGFRVTHGPDGAPLAFEHWARHHGPRALVVGNSTAWGLGVSGDAQHCASALNQLPTAPLTFNAAVKGSNLVQQVALAEAYLPPGADLVIVGGVLDLLFALAWPRDDAHGPLPFWNATDGDLTIDHRLSGGWHLLAGDYDDDPACQLLRDTVARAARLAAARGGRACFVLQPHLDFVKRAPTPAERATADALLAERPVFRPVHTSGVLRSHAAPFTDWLRAVCEQADVAWCDPNTAPAFQASDDLFVDHIHLRDEGHRRLAEQIAQHGLAAQEARSAAARHDRPGTVPRAIPPTACHATTSAWHAA